MTSTTIIGRVPIGANFADDDYDSVPCASQGEIIVVLCPRCKQLLIEYCCNQNWRTYITSTTYPQTADYTMGVIESGSYGHTDRIYCCCGITTEVAAPYCCSGEFAICWDPNGRDPIKGCSRKIEPHELNFDYGSFTPELEWFEVGVLELTDPDTQIKSVFVGPDCVDRQYNAQCLNCNTEAIVSMSYD